MDDKLDMLPKGQLHHILEEHEIQSLFLSSRKESNSEFVGATYPGENNSIYILRNGEIVELKGDKQLVGFFDTLTLKVGPSEYFSKLFAVAAVIAFTAILWYTRRHVHQINMETPSKEIKNSTERAEPGISDMIAHQLKKYLKYIYTSSNNLLQTFNNLVDMNKLTCCRNVWNHNFS